MKSDLLTHEQTLELIKQAQNGDHKARETLVIRNLALVKSIVKGFLGRGQEYDDLLQIGNIGLIKAIDGYNMEFNVRFSTYAVPMISGEIKRFLRDDGIIKVSRSLKENAIKIFRAQETLKKTLGREPTIEEIAQETQMDKEEVVHSMEAVREPLSIYEPIFEDESKQLIDTITQDFSSHMVDVLLLKELISKLEPNEREIIMLRFFKDKTQSEIAEIVGVSQVQISRILTRTLKKMREKAGK